MSNSELVLTNLRTQKSIFDLHQELGMEYDTLRSLLKQLVSDRQVNFTFANTLPSPTVVYFAVKP